MRELNHLDRYGDTFPLILSDMKRYNNRIRVKDESIAEHSFFVAYNILKIGYDYKLPANIINEAVSMAIAHDFPEVFTSDLPHDCKKRHPKLKEILSEIEIEFINSEMPELATQYEALTKNNSLSSLLVELADAISVLQYCNREISLGNNTNDMKIIHNESCLRVTRLFTNLEKEIQNYAKK